MDERRIIRIESSGKEGWAEFVSKIGFGQSGPVWKLPRNTTIVLAGTIEIPDAAQLVGEYDGK